ncbi:MAG: hypothetical protein GKR94_34625 [Gammaproteobacteria bacterium]|nr:hypothetical protein [Gammaproteobacteria bacterium]
MAHRSGPTQSGQHLILVGGGHSHAIVLRHFVDHPPPDTRITLIGREPLTPYSGMLPGFLAGHYSAEEMHIDLRALCRRANVRFVHDEVIALDLARRVVRGRKEEAAYDVLSINIGATPDCRSTPGAEIYATPVKPISQFVMRWRALFDRMANVMRLRLGVVGAGAGGVELILAAHHALASVKPGAQFHLFASERGLLPNHPHGVRRRLESTLRRRGIYLHQARVYAVTENSVCTEQGAVTLDEVLWATSAAAQPWMAAAGFVTDSAGFIRTDATLQSTSHKHVFAAGDCAHVAAFPRQKAGVFAVRQGPPLAHNLTRALAGQAPKRFTPQRKFLTLISTGDKSAVASRGGRLVLEGAWIWRWKDWIDRRFMAQFER